MKTVQQVGILTTLLCCILLYQNCAPPFHAGTDSSTLSSSSVIPTPMGQSQAKACGMSFSPGHASIHRLTNTEYNNTVRDLLFTTVKPADSFPPDVVGTSGFTNDSDALSVYDIMFEKYFSAAQSLAGAVIDSKGVAKGAYSKIASCGAAVTAATRAQCTRSVIDKFTPRAYRRAITTSESTKLLNIFNSGASFDEGFQSYLTAILISPKFLLVSVVNPLSTSQGAAFELSQYELASRLSYFLWQSMPDDELLQLASTNQLSSPTVLEAQTRRMLKDAKSASFVRTLRDEWLHGDAISSPVEGLPDAVRTAMLTETEMLLQDILVNDKPFSTMYTANYSYLNKPLADFYGLPGPTGTDFVQTPYNSQRQGVLSHGSFLAATGGMASETSIVKRGHALLESVLCAPLGDPPPGTSVDLINDPVLVGNPRQKLIQVTGNATCIGCHNSLNNLGYGLSQYSSFGQFRTNYSTHPDPVDSSGNLQGVITFANGADFLRQLPKLPTVQACFARQLMAIATTRDAKSADDNCVQRVVGTTTSETRISDTIAGIVLSRQFRMQTGEEQ